MGFGYRNLAGQREDSEKRLASAADPGIKSAEGAIADVAGELFHLNPIISEVELAALDGYRVGDPLVTSIEVEIVDIHPCPHVLGAFPQDHAAGRPALDFRDLDHFAVKSRMRDLAPQDIVEFTEIGIHLYVQVKGTRHLP